MATTKKFDLNIEKVLEDWGVHSALREVIANALDEQALTNTKDVEISKDRQGRWHVRDFGRGLRYEHLTQNENEEKQSHPDLVIGKFGVGLKDALATFDRHKIGVLITSRHGNITIIDRCINNAMINAKKGEAPIAGCNREVSRATCGFFRWNG